MTSAIDILSNIQSEYSVCLTVNGRTYVDRYPVGGGDVIDCITDSLVYTKRMDRPFSSSVSTSLGHVMLGDTNAASLTDEYTLNWRNQPFQIDVCGVINQGLANESIIDFDDRATLLTGFTNWARWPSGEFMISLSEDDARLNADLLNTAYDSEKQLNVADFDFVMDGSKKASSTGDIATDIEVSSLGSPLPTISIDFDNDLSDVEISLSKIGGESFDNFHFESETSTKINSTVGGIDLSVEIQNTTSSTQTVTISSSLAMDEMIWIFRAVDGQVISNWSIDPDSITPAFNQPDSTRNHEVVWSNMGGATSVTFQLENIQLPASLSADYAGRIYFYNTIKIWPTSIKQSSFGTSQADFTPKESKFTEGVGDVYGAYKWSNFSGDSLSLDVSFVDAISDPITMTAEGNKVILQNSTQALQIEVNQIISDETEVADKLRYLPLAIGTDIKNITPEKLNDWESGKHVKYNVGENVTNIVEVRDQDGAIIPAIDSVLDWIDAQTANTPGWLSDYGNPIVDGVMLVSGDIESITIDVTTPESKLKDLITRVASQRGLTAEVNDDIANYGAQYYFNEQMTVREALNLLLGPIDSVWFYRAGKIVVEGRVGFDMEVINQTIDIDSDTTIDTLDPGNELDRYHEIIVKYGRNWTVQSDVKGYEVEYESTSFNDDSVLYADYPTNTIKSGSLTKTLETCLTTADAANKVLERLRRESRRRIEVNHYLQNMPWQIEPNTRQKLVSDRLPSGMFVPHEVMENGKTAITYIEGLLYVD